jgi:TetR/AcrR family transcriptional regulator of autoinduction and epiphytic fitness
MTRKKRDTSRKRESILDAAVLAFADEGYENASMDRIAEMAEASKRTIYNHFPSKEALFGAVMERLFEETHEIKQIPYDPDQSLEEQLARFVDAKTMLVDNPAWMGVFKVALGVLFRDPELAEKTMAQALAGEDTLLTWIREAARDGRLNVKDPEMAADMFWGMASGALFWPRMLAGSMEPKKVRQLKKEIIDTFLERYGNR